MKYKSKPHTINAFQFTGGKITVPEWAKKHIKLGKITYTNYKNDEYVTVYSGDTTTRGRPSDWICEDNHENIFILSNKSFLEKFEEIA